MIKRLFSLHSYIFTFNILFLILTLSIYLILVLTYLVGEWFMAHIREYQKWTNQKWTGMLSVYLSVLASKMRLFFSMYTHRKTVRTWA